MCGGGLTGGGPLSVDRGSGGYPDLSKGQIDAALKSRDRHVKCHGGVLRGGWEDTGSRDGSIDESK